MNKKPFWEDGYKKIGSADTFCGGKPSAEFYDLIKELPHNSKVLDLGCGDGRNAIFLTENGFDVTAVDISATGIEKLQHLANVKGLSVATEIQDIRTYVFKSTYDLIIAHGCLHLIEREHWINLINKMKSHTNTRGYNVIVVFTDRILPPDDLKDFTIGLFHEGELFEFYKGWRIILQQSYVLEDEHPGGIKHKHPLNKIVAQKQ